MKQFIATVILFFPLVTSKSVEEVQGIKITRIGHLAFAKGSAENFTGSVRVDSRFQGENQRRAVRSRQ